MKESGCWARATIIMMTLLTLMSSPAFGQFQADEIRRFDGAMTSLVAVGAGTSVTTPSSITNASNDVAINIYSYKGNTTFTPPSGTGVSNIFTTTPTTGEFTAYAYSQTVSSSGGTAGNLSASLGGSGANWFAYTLPLQTTGTVTFTSNVVQQANGTGSTVSVARPALSTGYFLLGCAMIVATNNSVLPPAGFAPIMYDFNSANKTIVECGAKIAGGSEPSSYTFTQIGATQITAWVIAASNVLYPDELLTSASASFSSADVGKDICVASAPRASGFVTTNGTTVTIYSGVAFSTNWNGVININSTYYPIATVNSPSRITLGMSAGNQPNPVPYSFSSAPQSCGTIGAVLSGTKVVGYGIWNTSNTISSMEYRYGTDNTTALQNAINNLSNGGTISLATGGMMILGWPIRNTDRIPDNSAVEHHRPRCRTI